MTLISPLTEDEKRRRRPGGTLKNGEYLSFDISLRDSLSNATFATDSAPNPADADQRASAASAASLNDWRGTPIGLAYPRDLHLANPESLAALADAARERAAEDLNSWRYAD
ncbi:hypothetical protein [Altericroceibacterium xinjiangense]|uniref:hypothetical protein n=1 Tax=Altericroceibacterium xinjiangense TaxID=762261 RepID=UPI000F7FA922|nr:hypothetical protein [Altericroceibacterium xinjiangense]